MCVKQNKLQVRNSFRNNNVNNMSTPTPTPTGCPHQPTDTNNESHKERVKHLVFKSEQKYSNFKQKYLVPCTEIHPGVECNEFALYYSWNCLPVALKFYAPIHILPMLIFKRKQLLSDPVPVLLKTLKATCKSSAFICVYQFTLIRTICLLNHYYKAHRISTVVISAILASLSLLIEEKSRRLELALYLVPHCGRSIYNALKERGLFNESQRRYLITIVFSISSAILMYLYQNRKQVLKPSLTSLLNQILGDN
jgi:hypothetical protein